MGVLMRNTAIWTFGVLGSGMLGFIIGASLDARDGGGIIGFFGAAFVFACVRLWLTSRAQ